MEVFHDTILDENGNIINGASVTVYTDASTTNTANIFRADGITSLSNPFNSGYESSKGEVRFSAMNGSYNVKIDTGSEVIWHYGISLNEAKKKIAVLGASESVYPWAGTWITHLHHAIVNEGLNIDILHTGKGGISHYSALNTVDSENGLTYAELTVQHNPEIVIVELGNNDATLNGEGRSQAQIVADAQSLYNYLSTNLPNALLVYSRLVPYDDDQYSATDVTSIKKKYCVPALHNTSTMPGESGLRTTEQDELEKIIDSTMQNRLTMWRALDTTCQGLADETIDTSYFRPARLGLIANDFIHGTIHGHFLTAAEIWQGIKDNANIKSKIPELAKIRYLGDFTDPAVLWDHATLPDSDLGGDGYVIDYTFSAGDEWKRFASGWTQTNLIAASQYWGNKHKPFLSVSDRVLRSNGESFVIAGVNLAPGTEVKSKMWQVGSSEPSSFSAYSPTKYTTGAGTHHEVYQPSTADKPSGTWLFKLNVGEDVYGPFSVSISGAYPSSSGSSSSVINAVFRSSLVRSTAANTWTDMILNTTDFNDDTSVFSLNTSTGQMHIADNQGYTHYQIKGHLTIVVNTVGHFGCAYKKNGNTQHDHGAANMTYRPAASGYAPNNFYGVWTAIDSGGTDLFLTAWSPAISTVTHSYGIFAELSAR